MHCLGAAAGGGFPQWNCACGGCGAARIDPGRAVPHAAVAVSGTGERWFLVNATPDVHHQIAADRDLHPGPGRRETPLAGVLLTDAELDHTLGLLVLREGGAYTVFSTAEVATMLRDHFPVQRMLSGYADVRWREIAPGVPVGLDERLTVTAFRTGDKQPRYVTARVPGPASVVGYRFEDRVSGGVAVYAPGVSEWDDVLHESLSAADCVLIDGTFWSDDEMPRGGTGRRLGRQMGHVPVSGPGGSAVRLAALPARHKLYTHVNNTNPILDETSDERRHLAGLGIDVCRAGLRIEV